jgi:hypothetical protein
MTAPGVACRPGSQQYAGGPGRQGGGRGQGHQHWQQRGLVDQERDLRRQGSAVAYHWPSRVVDCSPSRRVGGPMRSSSFFVPRTMSTRSTTTPGHVDALLCRRPRGGSNGNQRLTRHRTCPERADCTDSLACSVLMLSLDQLVRRTTQLEARQPGIRPDRPRVPYRAALAVRASPEKGEGLLRRSSIMFWL